MAIPAALFMDGIMPQEGGVDSGILLEVHWPDFSGHVAGGFEEPLVDALGS